MTKAFLSFVKICLISVYLIILAGAIVRMTDSGMGCPDWPKCFGHLIPPTTQEEIEFKPNSKFKKGMIIINEQALFVAKQDFISTANFNSDDWQAYTKHNYAIFNATHTWVEYINRLVSALAGIFFLGLIIVSIRFIKNKPILTFLSFAALFLMLFEAWLGKTVVDSNLASSKIGIHMMVALLIVALLLVLLNKTLGSKKKGYDRLFMFLAVAVFGLSIIQILLGIEVRSLVDEQLKRIGFSNKNLLELTESGYFLVHRSFSIVVVITNIWLVFRNKKLQLNFNLPKYILTVVVLEAISGMTLYYLDFPFGVQALHLLFAAILFGLQWYLILQILNNRINRPSEESP